MLKQLTIAFPNLGSLVHLQENLSENELQTKATPAPVATSIQMKNVAHRAKPQNSFNIIVKCVICENYKLFLMPLSTTQLTKQMMMERWCLGERIQYSFDVCIVQYIHVPFSHSLHPHCTSTNVSVCN